MPHLVSIKDLDDSEFQEIVSKAQQYKNLFKEGDSMKFQECHSKLLGKTVALLFSKRSTRTRISSEGAATFFGAHPMFLGKNDIQLGVNESFYDTTKVISSMVSCIFARVDSHDDILALCKDSSVPVINSLCDKYHPLQAICDILTIKEHSTPGQKLKLTWIGDANNVINDLSIACLKMGIDVCVCTPHEIEMSSDIVEEAHKVATRNNSQFVLTHNSMEAAQNADFLVTDTFVSMGEEYAKVAKLKQFKNYQVNSAIAQVASPDYKFMHCLPRHNEEVTDEIFYSPHSIVFEEAENRLYAAMAAIDHFVLNH